MEMYNVPVVIKFFKTPSSMKHHAYCHGELAYVCDECKEGFAFKSELKFHHTVHCKVHSFHCMAKDCEKSYKSSNELNKHAQKHLSVTWDCSVCDYSTDDRRNLRAHRKKHLKVGSHKCIPCNKNFHYYMQLKRHRAKPECQGKDSKWKLTGIEWDNMLATSFVVWFYRSVRL